MASVRIYAKDTPYSDGKIGVFISVLHKRKQARRQLFKVDPKYWNGKKVLEGYPNYRTMNKMIRDMKYIMEERILEFDSQFKKYAARDVLDYKGGATPLIEIILAYGGKRSFVAERKYKNLAAKVKEFKPGISLAEVDVQFLDEFKKFLYNYPTINSPDTVGHYIKFLKAVLRDQFRSGNYSNQKVLNYTNPTGVPAVKEKLTREEFERFKECPVFTLTRDSFVLCVYLNGMRIGDLLQLTHNNVKNGRIIYSAQKTGKPSSIKILPEVQEILDRYKDPHYLIPILKHPPSNPKKNKKYYDHIKTMTTVINRELKLIAKYVSIDKLITTHVARHTFTAWASKANLNSRTMQELLNHSSLAITEKYLKEVLKEDDMDEAQGRVFG
jgi:integrase